MNLLFYPCVFTEDSKDEIDDPTSQLFIYDKNGYLGFYNNIDRYVNWDGLFISTINKNLAERGLGKIKNSIFESENYIIICTKERTHYRFWGITMKEWDDLTELTQTFITFRLLDMHTVIPHKDGKCSIGLEYYAEKYKRQLFKIIQLGPWATRQSYVYTINDELSKVNPRVCIEGFLCRFNKNLENVILVPDNSSPIWENRNKLGDITKRKLKNFKTPRAFYVNEQDAIDVVKWYKNNKLKQLKVQKARIGRRIDKINNVEIIIDHHTVPYYFVD